MAHIDALQRVAAEADGPLSREQQRFNSLVRSIGQNRTRLKNWKDADQQFRREHPLTLRPLREQIDAARRKWVFALDARIEQPGWTRTERQTLIDLVCESAADLIDEGLGDDALKALYVRRSDVDIDEEQRNALAAMRELTEHGIGVDLGDQHFDSHDQMLEHLHQKMLQRMQREVAEADAQEEAREARAAKRPPTAAQQRREAEAQRATQSVREVFRKLVSTLHPDREPDPAQRAAKTALMQEVNQANDRGDLLALLELQLRIEQIDIAHLAHADDARIRSYNMILAEQLRELREEIDAVELSLRMEFAIDLEVSLKPAMLGPMLQAEVRRMQRTHAAVLHEITLFDDKAAMKRWLKVQRRALRERQMEDDPFF